MIIDLMRRFALLLYLILIGGSVQAQERGVHRVILQAKTQNGAQLELYKESHALLIGVSEYTQWPGLDSIPGELDDVDQALKAQGFNVVRLTDPNSDELDKGIKQFIGQFGYERENRLLIYFSGHGYSIGNKGFLIPSDTPLPSDKGFRRKTFPMSRVLSWARDMEAKHVLFLFDSCFSGSIFKNRNLPDLSERYIRSATAEPVRQFITAGGADQEVPAISTFTPALVRAINGEGDLNNDGYVTGSELGVHLSQLVPRYVDQTPQYGKIKDYDLARGDFVFFNPNKKQAPQVASVSDQSLEALVWQSAERGHTVEEYQAYVDQYPNGSFTRFAQTRIKRLEQSQAIIVDPIEEEPALPKAGKTGTLTIRVDPEDARVRIMNIVPRYRDGIELEMSRRYDVLVTQEGYKTDRRFIRLTQQIQTEKIKLERTVDDTEPDSQQTRKLEVGDINFGSYHALIIGNNQYEKLQNLKTAKDDAIAVEILLREKYGFKTKLLLNATRHDMLSALKEMRGKLTSDDNLLIYYAGHGEMANDTGYWLPVDAEADSDINWIANSTISLYVETINAKHIIVIADSSFSGMRTSPNTSLDTMLTGLTEHRKRRLYETIASARVRTVFTSGGVKPVLNSVSGAFRQSIFTAAFLDELDQSEKPIVSTYELFLKVREKVKSEATRLGLDLNPRYYPLRNAGHESGDFLFVTR